jgi:hypothetical protein
MMSAPLSWKENARRRQFTARASFGGSYVLAPFLHYWNVDYRRGKRGWKRQQLGFAYTLGEAKAIAEVDSRNRGGCAP